MAFIVQLTNPLNEVQRFPIKAEVLDTQGLRSLLMLCVKRVSMTFFFCPPRQREAEEKNKDSYFRSNGTGSGSEKVSR